MTILKVFFGYWPGDVRVEKILRSLAGHGHRVTLLCRGKADQPRREVLDGVTVSRVVAPTGWPERMRAGATSPHPLNPWWTAALMRGVRRVLPQVVLQEGHRHD